MKTKGLLLGVLILLMMVPGTTALAQGPIPGSEGGRIFRNEDVTLEPGEIYEGALGIFNGDLDLPEGSTVNGDLFISNGDATIGGRVDGNVAVVGGHLHLAKSGWVRGDVFATGGTHEVAGQVRGNLSILFGDLILRSTALVEGDLLVAPGKIEREEGAQVQGNEVHDIDLPLLPFLSRSPQEVPEATVPPAPSVPTPAPGHPPVVPRGEPLGQRLGRLVGRAVTAMVLGVLLIAVGAMVVAIWPRATRRVSDCIGVMPVQSLGLGLLTFLLAAGIEAVAAVLMILLILVGAVLVGTVILIPVGLLLILLSFLVLLPVPLGLAGGMLLGWVGLAEWIGQKLLRAFRARDTSPLASTLVGLLITGSGAALLWIIKPVCCGWPFVVLLTSVGLGAVFHTRFGRQSCRSGRSVPAEEVISPEGPVVRPEGEVPPLGLQVLPPEAMDQEEGQPDNSAAETP